VRGDRREEVMNFSSKYNLGDSLAVIRTASVSLPPVTCSACEGTGTCVLRGETFACPKCLGKKTTQASGVGYVITDRIVVRYIRAETAGDNTYREPSADGNLYSYMATDSGSGSVYYEEDLWPPEDAMVECERRNRS
jgi:hypothetical protein